MLRKPTGAMLILIISPTKTLDWTLPKASIPSYHPPMLEMADDVGAKMKTHSQASLGKMMKLSGNLASLNYKRFKTLELSKEAKKVSGPNEQYKQAAFAFTGPAFKGFDPHTMDEEDLEFAQDHMRILCGLYGALRPLDLIQPYRLEMGTKVSVVEGQKDLYAYWKETITEHISEAMAEATEESPRILVNVASKEYSTSVDLKKLRVEGAHVIECAFYDSGRILSVYAKKARGMMARFIVKERVQSVEELKKFNYEGYKYSDAQSSEDKYVFTRPKPPPKSSAGSTGTKGKKRGVEKVVKPKGGDKKARK